MKQANLNLWVTRIREHWLTHGKFYYLRRAVWSFLAVDILFTIIFIWSASAPSTDIRIWFETGVPSNLIMVNTFSETPLDEVEIILDGRYYFTKTLLPSGTTGLPLETDFLSTDEVAPVDGYRPRHIELKIGNDSFDFNLDRSKK